MINPYNIKGQWLKGNLHTHTKNSPCGHYSLNEVIDLYTSYKMNYDFLAITDHFSLTDLSDIINNPKVILFQGVEYKRRDHQTLGININYYDDDKENEENFQELFNDVKKQGGINIICHPHVYSDDYWSLEKLMNLDGYTGIEIYNNNVRMDNSGRAVATDLWDKLLSKGKKVYGFANDDMHVFSRVGGGFNMVLSESRTRDSILKSIKEGRFYASSGVFLEKINVQKEGIDIKVKDVPAAIKFIGNNGKILYECYGNEGSFKFKGDEKYIRVEVVREDGAKAWLQPIFF